MWMMVLVSILFAQDFAIQNAKEVEIIGTNVNLQISRAKDNILSWSCAKDCLVQPEIKNHKVVIKVASAETVKLSIPERPLRIYANEAEVQVRDWQSDLRGRFVKVSFLSRSGRGDVDLTASNGDIQIDQQIGKIEIDIFEGNLKVSKSKGDMVVSQFAGKQSFVNSDGNLQVSTQKAETLIKNGKGKLKYNSVKGSMGLAAFKGEIRGESLNGITRLILAPQSKVVWKANLGEVQVKVPKSSAVDVGTKEGRMQLMSPLKANTEGAWKIARGGVSGENTGSVLIRTNKASIQLRSE